MDGWVGGHGLLYHFALEACMHHGSTSSLHNLGRVDVSKSNIATILTPIFAWYVYIVDLTTDTRNACVREIRLWANNMLIIIGCLVDIGGEYLSG